MKALSPSAALFAIAGLTAKRFLRGRALYVAAFFAALPLLPLLLGAREDSTVQERWQVFMGVAAYMHLLVASLIMAPAIAEEIEDKTYAYLWSRPIPRWTVLAGKLVTGSIIVMLLFALSVMAGASLVGQEQGFMLQAIAALALGTVSVGCISSSFGTLLPKYALALSISYFLVLDFFIGAMPFAGARLSVIHNVISLSGLGRDKNTVLTSALWLLGLAAFWGSITIWRLGKKELSTGS